LTVAATQTAKTRDATDPSRESRAAGAGPVDVAEVFEGMRNPNLSTGLRNPGREMTWVPMPEVAVPVVDDVEPVPKLDVMLPVVVVVGTPNPPPVPDPLSVCCPKIEPHRQVTVTRLVNLNQRTYMV
jgi:hypothetical protein